MKNIILDMNHTLTIKEVEQISRRSVTLTVSKDKAFRDHITQGADFLSSLLDREGCIYGVTTGYGDSCKTGVPADLVEELPLHLSRFHGCGLGDPLTLPQTRMVLAVRLASLTYGYSGVTVELLERLELLLAQDILPVIPSEGSVGASGDLTPLSYIAGVIVGEREVWYQGERRETADVYQELGITPYKLRPKEALALMNGTSVMTALGVEAFTRAAYLSKLCARLTSLTSLVIKGNPHHFDEQLFKAKPHPGQAQIAAYIRADLANAPSHFPEGRLQDRYSTRCAPHVIGVLEDMLPTFKTIIETEINSSNDNPLIHEGRILHGGHFYGGHIAFVMDSLKNLVANLADLLDRQMAILVDEKFNNGLPANLSGAKGRRASINHGLKALQIGSSAWAAEALKNTMPASVFSRSTESHNQDKVSMGTIAARDALRVLQSTEQVAAAHIIATIQGIRIRENMGDLSKENYTPNVQAFLDDLFEKVHFIEEDRPLESCLRGLIMDIQQRHWKVYEKNINNNAPFSRDIFWSPASLFIEPKHVDGLANSRIEDIDIKPRVAQQSKRDM